MFHKLVNCDRLLAVRDYFCTNTGKIVRDVYHLNNIFKVQGILKEDLSNHGQQRDSTLLYQLHFSFSCLKWTVNPAGKVLTFQIQHKRCHNCSHGLLVHLKDFSRGRCDVFYGYQLFFIDSESHPW